MRRPTEGRREFARQREASGVMSVEDNRKVVEAFYEAGNVGDFDGLLALLSDDIRWTNIGTTKFSMTCEGKQDLVDRLFGPLFSQLESGIVARVQNVIAEGDWVVVQLTGEANTKDGTPYNNTYCHVFRVADGQIVEATEYFDSELVTAVLAGE
jgi:ketosteroid isomerase-like protein